MNNILEFDSIELSFDKRKILSGCYVKCETGKVIGLLGRNGSGKSSMLKVVFGLLQADHFHVRINGEPVSPKARNSVIKYLPQENFIPRYLTLEKAFHLFKIPFETVLSEFPELEKFKRFKPTELSGGYRRIAEVLLILKSTCQFAFLDEPFSGLMPLHTERLMDIISREKKNKGILITDHLYRNVLSISDSLYMMANTQTYLIKEKAQLIKYGYLNEV